jgi:hypothetical protein
MATRNVNSILSRVLIRPAQEVLVGESERGPEAA